MLLHYVAPDLPLYLTADVSSMAVGTVIEQIDKEGNRRPLTYCLSKLTKTQQKWSAYDRELYALYAATEIPKK